MLQFFIAFLAKATFLNFFKMPPFANYPTIYDYVADYDKIVFTKMTEASVRQGMES
jgi:hypothetical protein